MRSIQFNPEIFIKKKSDRTVELPLYSCGLDYPPERVEGYGKSLLPDVCCWLTVRGVEKVGVLRYGFDDVNLKELQKIRKGLFSRGTTYHSPNLELVVEISAQSGLLQFAVLYKGKNLGTAEIVFEAEDDKTIERDIDSRFENTTNDQISTNTADATEVSSRKSNLSLTSSSDNALASVEVMETIQIARTANAHRDWRYAPSNADSISEISTQDSRHKDSCGDSLISWLTDG